MRNRSIVLIACLGAAWLPRAARAVDSPWLYGIHWYGDTATNEVEVMTGGKGIWNLEIVLTEDTGAWSVAGQLANFQTIVSRGHTLIIRIHPRWNLVVPGPNTSETAVGDRMETFIPKLIDAAQQLSGLCHIWQIGNEMNLGFEYDIGNLTPELYVEKYNEIRAAIHSVPSSLGPQIVLLGPVAPVDNAYLGAMCDALNAGGHPVDGFALHAYGGSRGNFLPDIDVQADLIDSKGFADTPLYITEWGAPVDPISDTNEAGVAQFLHTAFQDLADYNANPANHDIVCACWFIYRPDVQWQNWSIRGLHDVHPPGPNNDLYDAFQYACTLDLPAGEGGPPPSGPWISVNRAVLSPVTAEGQDAPAETFTVSNAGTGTLNYTITNNATWLSVDPVVGSSNGEADTITVSYDTDSLPFGVYPAAISIVDPNAGNSPLGITVNLTVQSTEVPPEIVNPGFEDDGGFFNVATGWTGFGGTKWERVWDPEHPVTQGVAEINVGGECGVYQQISVTPGVIYRVSMLGRSQIGDYAIAIGVDPAGGTSSGNATFGNPTNVNTWTQVSHDFTATGATATLFLRARHTGSTFHVGKWSVFDDVAIEVSDGPPTAPGDFDGDNDVDLEDFGHLQACLLGPGDPQTDPDCRNADLNDDLFVDQNDFDVFEACMTGANIAADPTCGD